MNKNNYENIIPGEPLTGIRSLVSDNEDFSDAQELFVTGYDNSLDKPYICTLGYFGDISFKYAKEYSEE